MDKNKTKRVIQVLNKQLISIKDKGYALQIKDNKISYGFTLIMNKKTIKDILEISNKQVDELFNSEAGMDFADDQFELIFDEIFKVLDIMHSQGHKILFTWELTDLKRNNKKMCYIKKCEFIIELENIENHNVSDLSYKLKTYKELIYKMYSNRISKRK